MRYVCGHGWNHSGYTLSLRAASAQTETEYDVICSELGEGRQRPQVSGDFNDTDAGTGNQPMHDESPPHIPSVMVNCDVLQGSNSVPRIRAPRANPEGSSDSRPKSVALFQGLDGSKRIPT